MEENKEELVYSKAPIWKRLVSSLIDFSLTILLAFTIFSLLNMAGQSLPVVKRQNEIRESLQLESGLYEGKEVAIDEYANDESSPYSTYEEKKDFLSFRLSSFYDNEKFANADDKASYAKRKEGASNGDAYLFRVDENGELVENPVNPSYLYDFYVEELNDYALAVLFSSGEYAEATKNIFLSGAIEFAIGLTLSVPTFYLLFPLVFFKRGRQTLGKKLLNVSLIGPNALNVSTKGTIFRYLFIYFVYYLLGFFSFLLVEIVSLFMLFFSKRRTNLVDYVLAQYEVDTTLATVYLDYADYLEAKQAKEKARLENNALRLSS